MIQSAYLRDLVKRDTVATEGLVDYRQLSYSHLIGMQTPAAMRERWRRGMWTIMCHNLACKRWDERWYINVWTVQALAGGQPLTLAYYLEEEKELIREHHHALELHPNVNRQAVSISYMLRAAEDPPPENLWEALRWLTP